MASLLYTCANCKKNTCPVGKPPVQAFDGGCYHICQLCWRFAFPAKALNNVSKLAPGLVQLTQDDIYGIDELIHGIPRPIKHVPAQPTFAPVVPLCGTCQMNRCSSTKWTVAHDGRQYQICQRCWRAAHPELAKVLPENMIPGYKLSPAQEANAMLMIKGHIQKPIIPVAPVVAPVVVPVIPLIQQQIIPVAPPLSVQVVPQQIPVAPPLTVQVTPQTVVAKKAPTAEKKTEIKTGSSPITETDLKAMIGKLRKVGQPPKQTPQAVANQQVVIPKFLIPKTGLDQVIADKMANRRVHLTSSSWN